MSTPDLADVFHTEYRRLTSGGRGQDEDVRDEAVSEALEAVEAAVREEIATDVEANGSEHWAAFIRGGTA